MKRRLINITIALGTLAAILAPLAEAGSRVP
jgi:hypothetical protein